MRNPEQPSIRRLWRVIRRVLGKVMDHPRTSLTIGVIGVLATLATYLLSQPGSSAEPPRSPTFSSGSASTRGHSSQTPGPLLSGSASCSDFRGTAGHPRRERLLVDSPGEIGGSTEDVRTRIPPSGNFLQILNVSIGDEVEVAALLHNPSYGAAEGVSASASISASRGVCWRIFVRVRVQSFPSDHPRLGPALVRLKRGGPATLEYVRGSTELLDEHGRTLAADLADGITQRGISLPYAVPGGTAYLLHFRVRVKARHASQPSSISPHRSSS
jgi:hypothetical protein